MNNSVKTLILTAAVTGFFGGTTTRMQAQPTTDGNSATANAGMLAHSTDFAKPPKHSCKGQNNCKGQGGCKSSDNGCKAKNSCKGKGGCATDGSPMPK